MSAPSPSQTRWVYTDSDGVERVVEAPDVDRARELIAEVESDRSGSQAAGLVAARSVSEYVPRPASGSDEYDALVGEFVSQHGGPYVVLASLLRVEETRYSEGRPSSTVSWGTETQDRLAAALAVGIARNANGLRERFAALLAEVEGSRTRLAYEGYVDGELREVPVRTAAHIDRARETLGRVARERPATYYLYDGTIVVRLLDPESMPSVEETVAVESVGDLDDFTSVGACVRVRRGDLVPLAKHDRWHALAEARAIHGTVAA